jgi:hypothetical protein
MNFLKAVYTVLFFYFIFEIAVIIDELKNRR